MDKIKTFYDFVTERQEIWYRKEILKQRFPFTSDKILQKYSFTNVYRILDTGTKYVVRNILSNNHSNIDKLFNCFVYRVFNLPETYNVIGFTNVEDFNSVEVCKKLQRYRDVGNVIFTSAFMVTGVIYPDTHDKVEKYCRVLEEVKQKLPVMYDSVTNKTMQECHAMFVGITGIGKFLSYQIMLDAMYVGVLPYTENDWAFAFLGCRDGLRYIYGLVPENKELYYMQQLRYLQRDYLPSSFKYLYKYKLYDICYDYPDISLSNIENCLCEFSKYMKVIEGTGKPRVLHKPVSTVSINTLQYYI